MKVLGISCFYHDSAACLLVDGEVIAASAEERFTRKKNDESFPVNAIEFCLEQAGVNVEELDYVVFYEKPFVKFERILMNTLGFYPTTWRWFTKAVPVWLKEKLWFSHIFKKHFKKAKNVEILFSDHHVSHAASSFYCSGFKESAILTADGVGEWTTSALGYADENGIRFDQKLDYPHSIGLLYSTLTAYLGFHVNSDEYKVMGLAAYGEPKYVDRFKEIVDVKDDGSFHLNMDYFAFQNSMQSYSNKFVELFGPPRQEESDCHEYYADLASSLQKVTEDILLKQANHLYKKHGSKNLCMAGGVALNCVANGRILRETPFENLYVQPAAGDAGGAIGAAMYVSQKGKMDTVYLGSEFTDDEILEFLESENLKYEKYSPEVVAKDIKAGKVLGWFQGRQEFGPRALGNRSIIADPTNLGMQDILNAKIKHRELFRPFAPSVLREDADKYFELDGKDSPYMLLVAPVRKEWVEKLPAITHVDGSARVQTVTAEQNPKYYELIKAAGGIVVNTSFNVRGEPIVRTPAEAYNCFSKTEMDVLVMGNYYLTK